MASVTWVSASGGISDTAPSLEGKKQLHIEADNGINPNALNSIVAAAQTLIQLDTDVVVKLEVGSGLS